MMCCLCRNKEQESVRPRWPYDMRPSVRAEKYIRDASGSEKTWCPQCVPKSTSVTLAGPQKTWPMATITGRTDRQTDRRTDRVRRNMRPPPREEGCIIIIAGKVRAGMAHSDCGWTCGCAGKTVKSLENTCHTWAFLRSWFTMKKHYIKCMHSYLYLTFTWIIQENGQ